MRPVISGIQQVGIGVTNADEAFKWYRKVFGTDVIVFKDSATASLMREYTGKQAHERYAILAMNMQSGGGFEIWQYTSRQPVPASFSLQLGDLGIFAVKIKSKDVQATYDYYRQIGVKLLNGVTVNPAGQKHFYVKDPYDNIFEIVDDNYWFVPNKHLTGSVCGAVIGVSSIEQSLPFYEKVLGYDTVVFSTEGNFEDWDGVPGSANGFKRVLLGHSRKQAGAFSKLLGPSFLELVEVKGRKPEKIFENRFWGDKGFIHLCFDITGMGVHEKNCNSSGFPFTVNSQNSFDMGEAAGHFAYNEDPDGTLIEYVETHRVPILKKFGLYLNLRNRKPEKTLPDWMVRCLAFGRVKD